MALVPPLPAGLSTHTGRIWPESCRAVAYTTWTSHASMPFPLPDSGAVAQELALLARTGDHPLFTAVADRCGREPTSRSLWHRFIARPGSQMAALATWLQAELDRIPASHATWHRLAPVAAQAGTAPQSRASNSDPARGHPQPGSRQRLRHAAPPCPAGRDPESVDGRCWPGDHRLPRGICHAGAQGTGTARTRPHLAEHMANYLRLSGQPDSGDDQTPRYHDRHLLNLLEEHLALDTAPPRVRGTRDGTPSPVPNPPLPPSNL